jgi:outer membrane biosynthesis protein TonB
MNSTCRTAIAAAVAGGYVLGRTRKAKVAFAVGTFLAGRRFGLTPTALAAEGLRQLRESPQLAELREQLGGNLLDAARAAASTSADRRFTAFADTLRERGRGREEDAEYEDEGYDEDEAEDEAEEPEEPEESEEDRDDAGHEPKEPARRAPAKKAAARKKSGPGKKAPAKKAAAKKTAAKKAASKRSASGRPRSASGRSGR